jgi:outer membrane protein TolC
VARVYFGILRNRYQLEVDSADIRRYQAMYTVSRALTGNGVNPGVDSSLAKAGLSRTRINYNQAMGNLRRLCQQLAYLTGLTDPGIRMDTSSGGRLRVAALSGDTAAVNVLTEYFVRRELRYGAEQELARKSYLPKVVAGAGGWARGSGDGLGYQRLNYLAGVGVVYDLFSGVHRRDRLAVLNGQIEAAGLELQQQRLSLQNQGSQADESIRVASRNLDELPVQLQAAADAYQQKLAQYKAGIVNLVELSNASFELLQAQTGYIEALNDWYTASLDKAALTGNLDQFLKSIK